MEDNLKIAHQDFFDMLTEVENPPLSSKAYNYRYADLPTLLRVVKPVLAKYNFAISQQSMEGEKDEVKIKTVLHHRLYGAYSHSVKSMWVQTAGQDAGKHAQAYGVVSTYCRRYAILEILNIVGEDDTDGTIKQNQKPKGSIVDPNDKNHVSKIKDYTIKTKTSEHLGEIVKMLAGRSSEELPEVVKQIREKYVIK